MEHIKELHNIKLWLKTGAIGYDEAKRRAAPHIKAINTRSNAIAKRHGVKPKHVTFGSFMR